jgi:hypothetical protein
MLCGPVNKRLTWKAPPPPLATPHPMCVQGVSQLSAAETAGTPGERAALAADALSHLLRVPQCCDLDTLTKRLASLRQWKVCECGEGSGGA